jgi:hypothetical protein
LSVFLATPKSSACGAFTTILKAVGDFLAGDFADALAFLEQLADEVPA